MHAMTRRFALLLTTCLLASAGMLRAQDADETPSAQRPYLTVPKMAAAPSIDGVIDEAEWAGATRISGFMGATGSWGGKVTPHESRIYLAHDGTRLYMAVFMELQPGSRPSMNYRKRDEPVYRDNFQLELWLTPPVVDRVTAYQMIGNAYGAIFDNRQIPELGISNVQWNGEWDFKNTYVTGEHWMAELAIDFDQFSDAPVTPDVLWRGMVGIAWPQRSWPYTFGWYKNLDTHAYLKFSDESDAVQVTNLRGFFENKLAPEFVLINSRDEAQTFSFEFEGRGQSWSETVEVPANAHQKAHFAYELPAFPENQRKAERIRMTVRDGENGILLDGDWFYTPAELSEIARVPQDPKPWAMTTRVQFAPEALGVKVWSDVLDFPRRDELKQVRTVVRAEADGTKVMDETITTFDYDAAENYLWLPKDLAYGDYKVEIAFENAEGEVLVSESKGFKHEDLTERFVWMGNELGETTTIYPPFEAVRVVGDQTLQVWGRDVTLKGAFPEQISSQGQDLLKAPVNLVAVVAGEKRQAEITEAVQITGRSDTEVTFTGAYRVAGLEVTLSGSMAYDGMIKYDLTATPIEGASGEKVERLYLSVPMVGKHAQYYFSTGGGWSPGVGLTQSDEPGESKIWDSAAFGDFVPYVGLVDDDIGLQWFADTDHHWVLGDEHPSSQIMRNGDTVEMQINFVRKAGAVPAFSAEFGLIATPIKALPANWRNTVLDNRKLADSTINFFFGAGHGNTPIDLHDTRKLAEVLGVDVGDRNPDVVLSELAPQAERIKTDFSREQIQKHFKPNQHGSVGSLLSWKRSVEKDPHAVRHAYFYNAMMYFEGNKSEAFRTFFPGEWVLDPPSGWFHLTATETYQDFFSFYLDLWFKHWMVPGLYFDEVYLFPDYNVFNGNGKVMEDGSVRPSFALMKHQRNYLNRMRQLFIDNEQEPFIWVHSSNFMAPYAISAADVTMFGEDRTPNPTTDIIDTIPAMLMRTIGRSQKFGFVPVWMTMAGRGGSQWGLAGRQTFGWCWQHDAVPEIHTVYRDRHLATLRAGWGVGADDVSFIPYWNTEGAITTQDDKVIASAWVRPGGNVLVQVMNLDDDNAIDAEIILDADKLGLTDDFVVLDLESDPVSKEFLAFTAEVDRLQKENPNASLGEAPRKWTNIQNMVTYAPDTMEVLSENKTVSLTVAPRNFRTFIVEPR